MVPFQAGKVYFCCPRRSTSFPEPKQSSIQGVTATLSLEVKQPGREADCSPSSSAEIKNAWSFTSNPDMRPGVYSCNFSFTAVITVHGNVFASPQNRFTEKVFTDERISVTLYTGWQFY